jgi:hypothetical protein
MTRRQRIDTAKGAKEIYDGAKKTIDPPLGIELGLGVRPYWDKLVKAKAGRSWRDQDLLMLVELSRNLYRTEKLSREILSEDEVIETAQGLKANPKSGIVDQLVKRARMIFVTLQIHPEATQGKAREQVKQNTAHAQTLNGEVPTINEDDLIARPTSH